MGGGGRVRSGAEQQAEQEMKGQGLDKGMEAWGGGDEGMLLIEPYVSLMHVGGGQERKRGLCKGGGGRREK